MSQAMVWSTLYKLAAPVLEVFYSDLFHDALWVAKNITPERVQADTCNFFYSVHPCGTTLVWKARDVYKYRNSVVYAVSVDRHYHTSYAEVKKV